MERYGARGGSNRDPHHQQQLQPWRFISSSSSNYHHESFSWPPRSYTCSFCKREFRSAQALGGHMNVHRRDRARLRHCSPPPPTPPWDPNPNSPNNPNPNSEAHAHIPNLNFSPPAAAAPLIAPLDRVPSVGPVSTASGVFPVGKLLSRCHETKSTKADYLEKRLRLDVGCSVGGVQEELDLELRLGYA